MAKKTSLTATLQRLLRQRPDALAMFRALEAQDDRTLAIIATTLLDNALEGAIAAHFPRFEDSVKIRLFEGDGEREGIISTFYAKISFGARTRRVWPEDTLGSSCYQEDPDGIRPCSCYTRFQLR